MNIKETALKSIQTIKSKFDDCNFISSQIIEKEYNFEISVKINSTNIKVQVYFGKKGVKTILQGDSASKEYQIVQNLILDQSAFAFPKSDITEPSEYIGTDECGKGDFFGPLVVGAAYVNEETVRKLMNIGVRDSKDLNEGQIHRLAREIKNIIDHKFQVIRITPQKYNDLYSQFKNLNKLLNWGHSKVIENLLDGTECKYVITDKFSKSELNIMSSSKYSDVEFLQIPKAEKYIGVAAASILARDNFDNWFSELAQKGISLPKGSSNNIELTASKLLSKFGEEKLGEFAKLHFKTLKKAKEY